MNKNQTPRRYYNIVDRQTTNPKLCRNGGDYSFGRTIAVEDDVVVGVKFWTSATDWFYCPTCGMFVLYSADIEMHKINHQTTISNEEFDLSNLIDITDECGAVLDEEFANGEFALIIDE